VTTIDRMLFAAFLRAYAICLVSTLSLYVVVDLFTNIDDFFQTDRSTSHVIRHILTYYGYQSLQYYDRLCEAIALLAAMFTVAWSQRNNEIIPLLSAGVSTRRFLRPILIGVFLMLGVGVVNQEFVIPAIAPALVAGREDPEGIKEILVQGCYDTNRVHIDGFKAYRRDKTIERFHVTLPVTARSEMKHLTAETAQYIEPLDVGPSEKARFSGGWLMTGTIPAELPPESYDPAVIKQIDRGRYFLFVQEATFDRATKGQKTLAYASTGTLYDLMQRPDAGRMNTLAVAFHMRLTRPIVGMLLVFMGLSIILRDQTRHVFISAGLCLAMCAIFFAVVFGGRFLGTADYVTPAFAAWLPVLVFGPVTFALYDAIHT
jgi:lipopolysaccharide export system permease protein